MKFARFINEYRELVKTSVRELWVIYFSKAMESIAYFVSIIIMVLYFSQDLGMTDIQAGNTFAAWSLAYGIAMFFAGSICDVIGIKYSLFIGFLLCSISRFMFGFIPDYVLIVFVALPLLAMGLPMLIPIKSAAIKQYTTAKSRGLAFAIFYALMNVGAFVAGVILDQLMTIVKAYGTISGNGAEKVIKKGHDLTRYSISLFADYSISNYQLVFAFTFILTIAGFLAVAFFVRRNSYAEEDIEEQNRKKTNRNPLLNLSKIMRQGRFWRFMTLLMVIALVRLVFTHMHVTLPKFMLREIGPDAAIGKIYSINGLVLMVLPPLISVFISRFEIYKTIIFGTFISASSLLFLAVDYSFYISVSEFLGIHKVYVPVILFYIFFSIGESIWNPKLYEYTANIAPKGYESTYLAWSMLPWILAKIPAGVMSGYLLTKYCPETGIRDSRMMWLIIALITLTAPVFLIFLKKFITKIK